MASSTWFWKWTEQEPSLDRIEGEAAALIFFQQRSVPCDFSPAPRLMLGTRAICTCGSMTFSAPRPKRYQGRTISSCALWLQQHRHTSPCSIVDGCLGPKYVQNPPKTVQSLYCSSHEVTSQVNHRQLIFFSGEIWRHLTRLSYDCTPRFRFKLWMAQPSWSNLAQMKAMTSQIWTFWVLSAWKMRSSVRSNWILDVENGTLRFSWSSLGPVFFFESSPNDGAITRLPGFYHWPSSWWQVSKILHQHFSL